MILNSVKFYRLYPVVLTSMNSIITEKLDLIPIWVTNNTRITIIYIVYYDIPVQVQICSTIKNLLILQYLDTPTQWDNRQYQVIVWS